MAVGCGSLLSDIEKYKNDSNEATFIKLVRTAEDVMNDKLDFHPAMSHQIFGDSETIFGYKDLQVKLLYHAGSLLTYLNMTLHEKVSPSLGITPDPVLKNVAEKLPEGHLANLDEFIAKLPEQESFVPPGEKIHGYTRVSGDGARMSSTSSSQNFENVIDHYENPRIAPCWPKMPSRLPSMTTKPRKARRFCLKMKVLFG